MSNSVGLSEMYETLGVAKQGSRYVLAYLCSNAHGKINKWARCKPERINSIIPITDSQRCQNNFGLRPGKIYDTVNLAIEAFKNGEVMGWEYEAPRTGTDHSRLSDFDGYDPGAGSPFGSLPDPTSMMADKNGHVVLNMPILMPYPWDNAIQITDFSLPNYEFKDWYPGVMLTDGHTTYAGTATARFSDESDKDGANWLVNLGTTDNLGMYQGVVFISSHPFENGGSHPAGARICFVSNIVDVELYSYESPLGISILASAERDISSSLVPVRFVVAFRNDSQTERSFSKVALWVSKDNKGVEKKNIYSWADKITVPAESEVSRTVDINLASQGLAGHPSKYIFFSIMSEEYNTDWIFMTDKKPGSSPVT